PYSGTYFVLASTYSAIALRDDSGLDNDYDFELTIEGADDVDDETVIEYFYGPLSIGDSNVEGYSNRSEPIFYWLFNGEEGQDVTVTMVSDDFDTLLYLFDGSGAMLAINDDADGSNSQIEGVTLPDDGTYLIFATDLYYKFVVGGDSTLFDGGDFEISLEED
ncbi:MAG: pre-peptidase C-terminal domain-containing protein, partial [Chloroflexota bacterium]